MFNAYVCVPAPGLAFLRAQKIWILWLKVLGLGVDQGDMEGSSGGDMKSLKLSKEDAFVRSKWRRLIRGAEEDSDDSWGIVSDCLWYRLTRVILG